MEKKEENLMILLFQGVLSLILANFFRVYGYGFPQFSFTPFDWRVFFSSSLFFSFFLFRGSHTSLNLKLLKERNPNILEFYLVEKEKCLLLLN